MSKILISLMGHQPLPVLMAIRHHTSQYSKPDTVILFTSKRLQARKQYLVDLVQDEIRLLEPNNVIDPWDIRSIQQPLDDMIFDYALEEEELVFDVTGGTKPMSIGLARVAADYATRGRNVSMIYIESESRQPLLRQYMFEKDGSLNCSVPEPINCTITIDDFLKVYLNTTGFPDTSSSNPNDPGLLFEKDVKMEFERLQQEGILDEVRHSVKPLHGSGEIDFILRKENRFALVECKTGGRARKADGVYILSNWASDRYLGTYTGKLLVLDQEYPSDNKKLAETHNVKILELNAWAKENRTWNTPPSTIRDVIRSALNE